MPQLSFARKNGIKIEIGDPKNEIPGKNIILPNEPGKIIVKEMNMNVLRESYIKNLLPQILHKELSEEDIDFLCMETKWDKKYLINTLKKFTEK